ncbi:hypothetical protein EV715DRAFT_257140 [Schizophyllum commune]
MERAPFHSTMAANIPTAGSLKLGEAMKTLVVFGDSFSATDKRELDATYSAEERTWVDFVKTHTRLRSPTIRNFAYPHATAAVDLGKELDKFFAVYPPGSQEKALSPNTTTYVFYFGINDCDTVLAEDVEAPIDKVLAAVRKLHEECGAKHVVLMDVPPLERAPEGMQLRPSSSAFPEPDVIAAMAAWNRVLPIKVADFQRVTPGVTLSVFSVRAVFTAVLDDPEAYGFTKNDLTEVGGGIWADEVHATPAVQEIVAKWLIEGKA